MLERNYVIQDLVSVIHDSGSEFVGASSVGARFVAYHSRRVGAHGGTPLQI